MAKDKIKVKGSSNFVVTNLSDYVAENTEVIIKDIVLPAGGTIARVSKQLGIKGSMKLNYLDVDPDIQDGSDCEFEASGDVTLSDRQIDTALVKVNMDICPKKLIGKYAEYLVNIGATKESLPFENYIVDQTIKKIAVKMDKAVWQWDEDETGEFFDGWLTQFAGDSDVIDVAIESGASAYEGIEQVILALPDEVLNRGAEVYVEPAIYRAFLLELVRLDYYHYAGPDAAAPGEFFFPGTDVKVVKTTGLAGTKQIVGTFPANLVYGTDLMSDSEDVDLWYSRDDRVYKLAVEWNAGVSYYFPDFIVLGAFAANPVSPAGRNAALNAIAANTGAIAEQQEAIAGVIEDVHNEAKNSLNTTATA